VTSEESPPSILAKAFTLLGAFSPDHRVMSLSEISRTSGLPKSTVHRLLARLLELGAIEQHRSGYRIGILLVQLGATTPAMSMRDVLAPHLATLHHQTGMTVHLGVLREFDVVILDKVAHRNPAVTPTSIGARLPANCPALGKVLLAFEDLDDLSMFLPQPMRGLTSASITDVDTLVAELRKVRLTGIAHDVQQAQAGVAGVAAPLTVMGSTVGAISVTYAMRAVPPPGLETILRDAANRASGEVLEELTRGRINWFPHEIDSEEESP
jgi:DNA-binding IclR family transcriptional regulator